MGERLPLLQREFALQGVEFSLHQGAILPHSVVASINKSHKDLVRAAKAGNLPEICIAEDDLMFTHRNSWAYFLSQKPHPNDYDLYVAATYVVPHEPLEICGFHLYFVSAKFYDRFLAVPDNEHIDSIMNKIEDRQYKVCYPFPALQRAGYSQNARAFSDYNTKLRPEDIYVG